MPAELPYAGFYYPLNVFMHVLSHEEGGVEYLHYGLFERTDERIGDAQERSTAMLFSRLPPPPATILEVGIGLATTLARLSRMGYEAAGITPDEKQVAMAHDRYGESIRVIATRYEDLAIDRPYDCVLLQESSQYIDSDALFAKSREITRHVVAIDEFAVKELDTPGALHALPEFLLAAARHGFELTEDVDLTAKAAPTVDYFIDRLPRYRESLIHDLGLTGDQLDELAASGRNYRELYTRGVYTYRFLQFRRR